MARSKKVGDLSTLQMALVGYQIEQKKIEEKIREIQAQLKGRASATTTSNSAASSAEKPARGKRVLSPAARKRIAAAQKKRWAEHRKKLAQSAKAEG
jgi:cell division septum initiation protein DivIVA